jgi:transposase
MAQPLFVCTLTIRETYKLRQLIKSSGDARIVRRAHINASYHCTKAVLTLLEDHSDHVFVVWLPKYSPELNLIEGLWGSPA